MTIKMDGEPKMVNKLPIQLLEEAVARVRTATLGFKI